MWIAATTLGEYLFEDFCSVKVRWRICFIGFDLRSGSPWGGVGEKGMLHAPQSQSQAAPRTPEASPQRGGLMVISALSAKIQGDIRPGSTR